MRQTGFGDDEKMLVLAACVLTAGVGTVRAACNSEIEKTKNDLRSIRLEPASKPSGSRKVFTLMSTVDSMRYHLAEAEALCKEGKDHESLLHLDVLRAFLMLPEIQHQQVTISPSRTAGNRMIRETPSGSLPRKN
jgi:hypothetical protein